MMTTMSYKFHLSILVIFSCMLVTALSATTPNTVADSLKTASESSQYNNRTLRAAQWQKHILGDRIPAGAVYLGDSGLVKTYTGRMIDPADSNALIPGSVGAWSSATSSVEFFADYDGNEIRETRLGTEVEILVGTVNFVKMDQETLVVPDNAIVGGYKPDGTEVYPTRAHNGWFELWVGGMWNPSRKCAESLFGCRDDVFYFWILVE